MDNCGITFAETIISKIRETVEDETSRLVLHEPLFRGNEWLYIKECLDTGWVSSVGKYVDAFEHKLEKFTGAKHAIAVSNGTAALHIALLLGGVEKDDEVIIPSLSFVATANAVAYCGAVPHFAEIDRRTLGLDAIKLAAYLNEVAIIKEGECYNRLTKRRMKAVVPMHTFGHPVDMEPLLELADLFRLTLVEDAAESLGSYYKGKHTGTLGQMGAISFNGNKVITTGGGGALLTNDSQLAAKAKHLTTTAKLPHAWEYVHDQIGYNYRLPNLNAALGCAQLEQLPAYLKSKRALAQRYNALFSEVPGVRFFEEQQWAQSNYWLNCILLEPEYINYRNQILEHGNQNGVMMRPVWKPLHQLPMFADSPSMRMEVTELISQSLINIPSGPGLSSAYAE